MLPPELLGGLNVACSGLGGQPVRLYDGIAVPAGERVRFELDEDAAMSAAPAAVALSIGMLAMTAAWPAPQFRLRRGAAARLSSGPVCK